MSIALTLSIGLYLLTQTQAQIVDCEVAFQCEQRTIASNATHQINAFRASGYKSAVAAHVNVSQIIFCQASHSCYQTQTLFSGGNSIECTGDLSCFASDNPGPASRTVCHGSNACNNLNLETGYTECYSDGACAQSTISLQSTSYFAARGAYAMYNATITSPGNAGNVRLEMRGYYAGYGATFHCQAGDQCTISCEVNACEMLYLQCDGDCTLQLYSDDAVPPITNISMRNLSETVFLYDSLALSTEANDVCDTVSTSLNFDDSAERDGGDDIDTATDAICCRGLAACQGIESIVSTSEYPILCSGDGSCQDVDGIVSADDLICSGSVACKSIDGDVGIKVDGNIYCLGYESCQESEITVSDDQSLYCSGYRACGSTTIESNGGVNIYFLGQESGNEAVVNCLEGDECNIVCGGYSSCSDLTANCDGLCSVQCDGDTGCPEIVSANPTPAPTNAPSVSPTVAPSQPTSSPSAAPTRAPTPSPTEAPTVPPTSSTKAPTDAPSVSPTVAPSQPTNSPSAAPTNAPTSAPSMSPVDSSDSGSESGSDSDSDEIAMALFSAQRTDENVDEYGAAKQYHLTVGLNSTSWMQLWAIFGALMILNVICFFIYCRKKAN